MRAAFTAEMNRKSVSKLLKITAPVGTQVSMRERSKPKEVEEVKKEHKV